MKKFADILHYLSLGLILCGIFLRIQGASAIILLVVGLFIIFLSYFIQIIKQLIKGINNKLVFTCNVMLVFMPIIIFSKYLFHDFGDYPALLIVPIFIATAILYLIKGYNKNIKTTTASVTFLLLTVPLFGFNFHNSPRHYIPIKWYNRFSVSESRLIELPYSFKFEDAEILKDKALDFQETKDYSSAIEIYREALNIEPDNPVLFFGLSECYAYSNQLEKACEMLDTAIILDSNFSGFYNNRGLIYYKLNENDKAIIDFDIAIQLDSISPVAYSNRALVYISLQDYEKACESLIKAEELGYKTTNTELKWLKNKKCK